MMQILRKRLCVYLIIGVLLSLGGAVGHAAPSETDSPKGAAEPAENKGAQGSDGTAATGALQPVVALLSSLVLTTVPGSDYEKAGNGFATAEDLREQGRNIDAILAYISLIDAYPTMSHARAADSRANYLMHLLESADLDALEEALPAPESLKSLAGLTILGQYHYLCAQRAAESDPKRAGEHIQALYEMAWRAFEEDLDDDYKQTILEEYLKVADTLGRGKETRAALSAHADTLPWSFTRWLIKAEVDGVEPSVKLVPSQKGLEAIRKYYLLKGRAASDPAAANAYFTKCCELAQNLLAAQPKDEPKFDLAHVYLEAAHAAGPRTAAKAVAFVEDYVQSQRLSIMRWIVRYELGVYLTRQDASSEETRAGFAHFEKMLDEADTGLVEPVVRDSGIDPEIRGLLACVWGNAFAGTNHPGEAALFYDWVLDCCPPETHPGASAGFGKTVMYERENGKNSAACVAAYEQFAQDHPSSFHAPEALLRVAEILKQEGDLSGARQAYERVKREYEDRSASSDIDARIEALAAKEDATEQP